ncbi:ABC transporter ATP-binding protein [Dactylosporangium sp. NPDC049525]|uniref:ABC transporter ATP-binding protein n=1 Tax=Dactylosporangium sp. NPDC049525 TaxID=3154730 RepID=UPI00341C3162
MAHLTLRGVTRRFGDVAAVDGVDLDLPRGEIFALLGPSGCGKSTTLRMIAGLERVDAGTIAMAGRALADGATGKALRPEKRNIAMVFQSYAVWPHMTVGQNVEFPLKMRGVAKAERRRRVADILEVTGLGAVTGRSAAMLSGGQQQRVALARALVYAPDLLLLDEPLSNLDAKLRTQMRHEIRRLNRELGTTMLFVTHDQDEALSLADRVAVMHGGRVEQVGAPTELYERPATPFVRDFLGRVVMVEGILARTPGGVRVLLDGAAHVDLAAATDLADGDKVALYCRPEDLDIRPALSSPAVPNELRGVVESAAYLGDSIEYILRIGAGTAVVTGGRHAPFALGDTLALTVDPARATVWPR